MTPLQALGLEALLSFASALLAAGSLRALALVTAGACAAAPFFIRTGQPLATFYLALYAVLVVMRTLDLVRGPGDLSALRRLWHVHAIIDTRRTTPCERAFDGGRFAAGLAWQIVGVAGLVAVLWSTETLTGPSRLAVRWVACAVGMLAGLESLGRWLPASYALAGLRSPPVQENAWASRSIREFWGVRWNQAVGGWLREHFHEPLRRRGRPVAGVALAFLVSTLIHCYLTLASLGPWWAFVMSLFFLLQISFIAAERALGVAKWSPAAARVWTIGLLAAASPLFTEPMAQAFDPLVALLPGRS